jgi:hypothetical protein
MTNENSKNQTVVSVWEINKLLELAEKNTDFSYESYNIRIKESLLEGELGAAKNYALELFLAVAELHGRDIENMEELRMFCSKVILTIVHDKLPQETIDKIVLEMEKQFKQS